MKNMVLFPSLSDDEYEPKLILPVHNPKQYHIIISKLAEKITNETCWFEMSIVNPEGRKTQLLNLMDRYLFFENCNINTVVMTDCGTIEQRAKTFPNSWIILPIDFINKIIEENRTELWNYLLLKNIKFLSLFKSKPKVPQHSFFDTERIVNLI